MVVAEGNLLTMPTNEARVSLGTRGIRQIASLRPADLLTVLD